MYYMIQYWIIQSIFIINNIVQYIYIYRQQMGNCQAVTDIQVPTNFSGIIINCRTWKKTYSNLYDYTAQPDQYTQTNLTVHLQNNQCNSLIKIGEQLKIIKNNNNNKQGYIENQILKLTNRGQSYIIKPSDNLEKLSANQVWLAVKSTPSQKYKIKQGDVLRIGNQKIKIKEIIFQDNTTQANQQIQSKFIIYQNLTKENSQGYNPKAEEQQPMCRVCLEEGQINNPLIAPCKCSGSAKFIHIKCIQEWFNKLINPRVINSSIVISWKPLVCELCAQSLPFKIYLDEAKHFTVNIPRPEKPYIVLNPLTKQKSNAKIYHLITFNTKKVLTIGRKKDADIILDQDSTISRYHSILQFQKNGKITISDKDSKFGTLVLLKKQVDMSKIPNGLILQFGGNIAKIYSKINNSNYHNNQLQINSQEKSQSTQSVNQENNQQSTKVITVQH